MLSAANAGYMIKKTLIDLIIIIQQLRFDAVGINHCYTEYYQNRHMSLSIININN